MHGLRRLAQKCPVESIRLVERSGVCADDEREPLIPTPDYALTAAHFPVVFALARFGFAGDNGSPNLIRLASRIRGEPVSRRDAARTLQVLVVPGDERTLTLLSNLGIERVGTTKKQAGTYVLRRLQECCVHGYLRSDHSIHERMGQLLTLCTIAKPTSKRTGNFGSAECGLNHRNAIGDDLAQQIAAWLMELVSGICGGDPNAGINR